RRSAGIHP
ncbi:mandelate racemase/muconate lactonizing enzyme, C-terminal domain protein, partial [Streptomyces ipomoeae 91-03]